MPDYNAGTAAATYDLRTEKFDAAAARIIQMYAKIEAAQQRASKPSAGGGASDATTTRAAIAEERLATQKARTAAASNQAAVAAQREATEKERTAAASTAAAKADQQLAAATANAAAAQDRAAVAAQRRRQAESNGGQGAALPRTFAGFTGGGLAQAAGAFGLATLGPQVVGAAVSKGIEAGQNAIALRETQNSLRAVAGDQATYNQVVGEAQKQQRLFGGSLQENIEGLSGLTITARSSGAQLSTLIDLSQRLGVLDPAQGTAGARIALNEALSGDPTSLAKRYEIPKAALAQLRDTTIPVEERLKVIDSFLNKVGITSASVAGKVDQTALAYRGLSAELGNLTTSAGGGLADIFAKPAEGLSRLIGLINGNPEAIAKLQALKIGGGSGGISDADVKRVARDQAASTADLQTRPLDTPFNPLASDATRLQADMLKASTEAANENRAAIARLKEELTELALSGGPAADSAAALSEQLRTGAIDAPAFAVGVNNLYNATYGITGAFEEERHAAAGLREEQIRVANATQQAADTSLLDGQAKQTQAAQTELLNFQTQQAAQAFLGLNPNISQSGLASAVAAGQISASVAQYIAMTLAAQQARNQLAQLQAQAGLSPAVKAAVASNPGDVGRYISTAADPRAKADGEANVKRLKELNAQEKAVADARRDQVVQTGSAAAKQKLYSDELARTRREYGANSEQAIRAKTALDQYSASQEKAGKKGKGAKEPKLSDQQKLNNSLLSDQDKFNDQFEDAELTHAKNLLKIQRDYEEKSLQQQRANEISKRQSEADFLDRLTSSDLNKGDGKAKKGNQAALQQINADYYASFQKAQELAQEGKVKESAGYLDLKQKQLEQELSYQERLSAAREKKDKGEETRLIAIHEKRKAVDAEQEKQLLEGGDSNQKARDEALQAEDVRYEEAQGKIAESSDRATERKILNAQRAKKEIDVENLALSAQADLYSRIPSVSSGAPQAPQQPTTPQAPAATSAPAVATEMWHVSDVALLSAVNAQTDMQRGMFGQIVARLGDVERAVRQGRGGVAA